MIVWIGKLEGFELDGILLSPDSGRSKLEGLSSLRFRVYQETRCVHEGFVTMVDLKSPEVRFSSVIRTLIKSGQQQLLGVQFASILESLQEYRGLLGSIGKVEARKVLASLHDISYARMRHSRSGWYSRFLAFRDIQDQLLRDSEASYAFANLKDLFFDQHFERLDLASSSLSIEPNLNGFSAPHKIDLKWRPNSTVSRYINILIGENGTGKTQALFAIAHSVGEKQRERSTEAQFSRVLLIGANWNLRRLNFPKRSLPGFHISSPANAQIKIAQILSDLLTSKDRIAGKSRLQLAVDAFSDVFDVSKVGVHTKHEGWFSIADLLGLNASSYRRLGRIAAELAIGRFGHRGNGVDFSSGHMQFVWIILNICKLVENGSLVLIDEPEIHLHPRLIGQLKLQVDSVLKSTGSFAVMATHSAYLVREVPSDCVLMFSRHEDMVNIRRPKLQTFGAEVGLVTYFVFEDEVVARSLEGVADRITAGGVDIDYDSDLSVSARFALAGMLDEERS